MPLDIPESIDDLKPDPQNPRRIGPVELEALSSSIEEFGDISGIVWNQRTGHLVCGHQRVKVLRERGATLTRQKGKNGQGKAIVCDPQTGERYAVRVVDWDENMEKAANVAANAITGEFLPDALDRVTQQVALSLPDIHSRLKFDSLESIQSQIRKAHEKATGPDTKPEIEFARELLVEHNYIVLAFDNPFDWNVACEIFGLKPVKWLKKTANPHVGLGRVIDGKEVLERLQQCET